MSQHLSVTRMFEAPCERVYQAFTDPEQLSQWFGPDECSVPRESIEIDVRVGGHLRYTMIGPGIHSAVEITFTDVVENRLLAGELVATGVPGETEPLHTRLKLEFHDEGGDKTRLELHQGPFPARHVGAGARAGWESVFAKLDALL